MRDNAQHQLSQICSFPSEMRFYDGDFAKMILPPEWISNPSVGCSSHPGRAASLWGTIQKCAALVGSRLCFVSDLQRGPGSRR